MCSSGNLPPSNAWLVICCRSTSAARRARSARGREDTPFSMAPDPSRAALRQSYATQVDLHKPVTMRSQDEGEEFRHPSSPL
ncbi:hypothetical protein Airi01_085490 [Actinoallomurus iriomotensis]|uniref:Uncharacterized protein n=1 Tax=Actinoallomurus iriomotensis TaxID=478107 RepID=A0A9W6RUD0_9ACTN|nr:hypothetical protein Airi01_085490 [Actinoallomurus iriomotensis]